MKKHFIKLLLLASAIVLTNCKKYGKTFDTYFYTDMENSNGPLFLYIDGDTKGELPNLKTTLSPANDTILSNALHFRLRSGKYKIEGKDHDGTLKFSGYLKFRPGSIGTGGTMGGSGTSAAGNVIVTKIFY